MSMEYLSFLLLFGPGIALAFYLVRDTRFSWLDYAILGVGMSLAFYPLFLLGAYVLGVPVNSLVIYLVIGLSLLYLGWQGYTRRDRLPRSMPQLKPETLLGPICLLLILGLSAYVRMAVVKDLQVPMWADSLHHTMISQLIVDHQGLFSSWLPYAPMQTFTYHFGFHSLVASYHWLTGIPIPRAVVVTGQVVNFSAILGCYLLTRHLTQKPWAGIFAALFVGLISNMPAYYFN